MKFHLTPSHRFHARSVGHPSPPRKISVDQAEYENACFHWSQTLPDATAEEIHQRALAHVMWHKHKHKRRWNKKILIPVAIVVVIIVVLSLRSYGQLAYPIEIQNAGTQIGFHKSFFIINCSTGTTCTDNGQTVTVTASASGGIPSGLITMIASGTCPSGFTEVTALDGKFLQGTLAAHGDVGTTGGNSTITPSGTVSQPSLTMNSYTPAGTNGTVSFTPAGTLSWPAGVPTFTGSSGTVPAETFTGSSTTVPAETISWPAGVPTNGAIGLGTFVNVATATSGNCAATAIAAGTGSLTACKTTSPNLTVPAESHSGSLTSPTISWPAGVPTNASTSLTPLGSNGTVSFTPAGTIAWPAGVPTFSGGSGTVPAETFTGTPATLTGTVTQPTFTGNAVDPRPQFTKVIFCSAN